MRSRLGLITIALVASSCGGGTTKETDTGETASASQALSLPCALHNVHVVDQPGPTQGLWNGTDATETAPALATSAEFVFVFDKPVLPDELAEAASITLQSCPGTPNPASHSIPIQVVPTNVWLTNALTIRHSTEPFVAGCAYTLSIPNSQPVTGALQCLDKSAGFTFRVRGRYDATPLPKEAASVRYRPKAFDVAAFGLPTTSHLKPATVFQRYAEDLKVRPYIDTFAADPTAHSGYSVYTQSYFGIPVSGYGYVFSTDSNGNVKTANGHIAQAIGVDIHPLVLDAAAVVAATTSVLTTQQFSLPPILLPAEKKLIVVSRTQSPAPPQFRLAWSVRLVDQLSHRSFSTVIDARDLSVVRPPMPGGRSQCTTIDVAPLPAPTPGVLGQVTIDPQTTFYQDPDVFEMSQYSNGAANPLVLRTDGVGAPVAPLVTAQCGTSLNATTLATVPGTTFDGSRSWTPEVTSTAASYMAVQRVMEYLVGHEVTGIGLPQQTNGWIGVDGQGLTPINVRVESRDGDHFDPATNAGAPIQLEYQWSSGTNVGTGAALDSVGHEFGHGILNSIFPSYSDRELGAIDEGFGDIVGSVVEHTVRNGAWTDVSNPVNWCIGGDPVFNTIDPTTHQVSRCLRDLQRPDLSFQRLSTTPTTPGGPPYVPHVIKSPNAYGDCNYYNPTTGFALDSFVHINSTVLGHWFELLVAGGTGTSGGFCDPGTTGLSCDYQISGPAPSFDQALAIVLHGLQRMGVEGGFEDLADATVSIANDLFPATDPDHDARVQRVAESWAAVGVWEKYWEGTSAAIIPARNEVGVNPWQPIEWIAKPGESSWQVDVATDQQFTNLYASRTVTETTTGDNGQNYAVLRVALQPNTQYFWREREASSTNSWDCSPVHFFMTGAAPTVGGIKVTANLTPDGLVRPGTITAQWNALPGATSYKIDVGTSDSNCASGSGVTEVTVPAGLGGPTTASGAVSGVQPSSTYSLDVQAKGPNDPTNAPTTSSCAHIQFFTTTMRPPVPKAPLDGSIYEYASPHNHLGAGGALSWSWDGFDGPDSFTVEFYPRNQDGTCSPSLLPANEPTVTANCPATGDGKCSGTLSGDFFPTPSSGGAWADPAGYCWDVVSVAKNHSTARSAVANPLQHYSNSFQLSGPQLTFPGLPFGVSVADRNPGVLPGRAYEDTTPLTFTWSPVPLASGYFFVLGRWPWLADNGAAHPVNCEDPQFCNAGPDPVIIPASEVGFPSARVDANASGQGRYCWTVWPELQDPLDATKTNAVQPLVDPQTNVFCYSSEAATPLIEPAAPLPNGDGFSSKPIDVKIKFPYIPDATPVFQDMNNNLKGSITHTDACDAKVENDTLKWQPGDGFIFHDLYNCEYDLIIAPDPGTSYHLHVVAPGYATNPSADLTFTTGTCGNVGDSCCDNDACNDPDATCNSTSHKCERCSADGDKCCAGNVCQETGPTPLSCRSGVCTSCGFGGQEPCCDPPIFAQCQADGTTCVGDRCIACGQLNQPCCVNDKCAPNTTFTCDTSTKKCVQPCISPTIPTGLMPGQQGTPTDDTVFGPAIQPAQQPVTLHWTAVPGASSYNVQWTAVSAGLDGTLGTFVDGTTEPTQSASLSSPRMNNLQTFAALQISYKVQAVSSCGATTPFSPAFSYWLSAF